MSDEQMIYIDPEDDLTNVRTRLEGVESRHITLVIPAQTQLRSHVAWKLLHARARELGKDILIISADPQIRSVAQAVKFRVANSLEAAQESKPRPSTRPSRSPAPTNKGRSSTTRTPRSRQLQSSESWPSQRPGSSSQSLPPAQPEDSDRSIPRLSSSFSADERTYGRALDYRLDSPVLHPLSDAPVEEPDLLLEDFHQAEDIREAASQPGSDATPAQSSISAYKITPRPPSDDPFAFLDEKETGAGKLEQHGRTDLHNYNTQQYPVENLPTNIISNTNSSSISDDDIEFEGDLGDFVIHSDTTPKTIHHSWSEPTPDDEEDFVGPARTYGVRPRGSRSGQVPPLPRSQQIESEDALPPIENRPTRQPGRTSKQLPPSRSAPLSPRASKPLSRSDSLSGRSSQPLASRADPLSPRVSKPLISKPLNHARSGYLPPARPSQPLPGSRSDALRAAPLDNRTEMQAPPRTERPRPSQPLSPQEVARVAQPATRGKVAQPPKQKNSKDPKNSKNTKRPQTQKRSFAALNGATTLVAAIVLVFILVAALAYFLPGADVRVGLPGRTYTHQVQLTLSPNHSSSPDVLTGTTFTHDMDLKGTGSATGTTVVGTVAATGYVIFTNLSSTAAAHIPTNSVVSTSTGLQFVTTSQAVALPKGSDQPNTIQVPIKAIKAGNAGNVPQGSITIITDNTITMIAQSSNAQPSDIQLTVVNPSDITGGGAGNAPQVKQQDLDSAQAALGKQFDTAFSSWLKTQVSSNDLIGLPDKNFKLLNAPKADQILPADTTAFSLEVEATYSVLVLHNSDLQSASRAQLNTFLAKEKAFTNYTMANDAPVTVDHLTLKSNGNNQIATFNATSQAVPDITSDEVRSLIVGKSIPEAQAALQKDVQSVTPGGKVEVTIKTYPLSFPLMPYKKDNIHVLFFATQSPTGPGKAK